MGRLISVNVGRPRDVEWNGTTVHTAIWKAPVRGRVLAQRLNLEGDGQADLRGHGGEQRAVLVYDLSSYHYWNELLGLAADAFGQFGENFTVDGLEDCVVCIGDRYRIGSALFEVSQPRTTCFKVGLRLQQKRLPALMVGHGRPGFYMRVIQEGHVGEGDEIVRVANGPERMTVTDTDALLYKAAHPVEQLERALRIPAMSPGWKQSFEALQRAAMSGPFDGNPGLRTTVEGPVAWKGFEPLRVIAVHDESEDVRSFVLASGNDAPLPCFRAGQHVAIRLRIDDASVTRLYSLSSDPRAGTWRIGVKREPGGLASNHLHRHVRVGDELEVSAPRGTFGLQDNARTVVLLSAGIGVTPLLCMLYALASAGSQRSVWWVHATRDGRHHSFKEEALRLVGELSAGRVHVVYSRPGAKDALGARCDETGHVDVAMLARLGVSPDSDFYLCGPAGFLATLESQLQQTWGVNPARISSEVFGVAVTGMPAGRPRPHPTASLGGDGPRVTFARSGRVVRWSGAQQNLLELAEACDIATSWSCRSGVCQSCECPLIAGAVAYAPEPIAMPSDGTVLLCCARPSEDVELDL